MPLIGPPSTDYEPLVEEKKKLIYKPPFGLTPYEDHRRVKLFDNCPNWKCKCGLTFHGRVEKCVRALNGKCDGIRPEEWKPHPIERSFNE